MPAPRAARFPRLLSLRLPRLSAAELAIALLFASNGLILGSWIVRIPAITRRLDLDTGTFGLILPAGAIGAILGLPIAGKLCARWGSGPVVTLFSLVRAAVFPLAILVPHPAWFAVGLFAYGLTNGAMDVALNAQGVEVERARHRSILSFLHGCSSLGSLIGSLVGGIAAAVGLTLVPQFVATGAVIAVATLTLRRHLVPDEPMAAPLPERRRSRLLTLPPRALLPFGVIAFCAMIGEAGVGDWSSLYLRNELDVSASLAAYGYTAFALCMLIGRLLGDTVIRRLGQERALRMASAVAGTGLLLAAGLGTLWAAYLGFAITGLGMSVTIPIIYRMAGNATSVPRAQAVASTALIGYMAFLAGPLVLGTIGDVISLRGSIATMGLVVLGIQLLAHTLRPASAGMASEMVESTPVPQQAVS